MTDYLELNVETIGTTFRNQASGLRHLADQVLDDDFRGRLLEVASDYDHQAKKLENEFVSQVLDGDEHASVSFAPWHPWTVGSPVRRDDRSAVRDCAALGRHAERQAAGVSALGAADAGDDGLNSFPEAAGSGNASGVTCAAIPPR